MNARLGGGPGPQGFDAFERGFAGVRRKILGPFGCLFALLACTCLIVLLPFVLILLLWKGRRLREVWRMQSAAERTAPAASPPAGGGIGGAFGDAADARASAMFVRAMSIDETFTRDDARQAGVAAGARRTSDEVLDDAVRRGWVEERGGGRFAVTSRGRDEADRILR